MEAKYIMDMQTNFLILEGKDNTSNNYAAKMILNNNILGLLKVERRSVDDKDYFYYNITSKESLLNIYENKLLRYVTLKNLLIKIIDILERSSDFLLEEEGFILVPEHIYIDQSSEEPFLCYHVDYKEPLVEQFSRLLEYFMNKVDYKDEQAVLLVYALYKITKESNITYGHLKDELYKDISGPQPDHIKTSQMNDREGTLDENSMARDKSKNLLDKNADKEYNSISNKPNNNHLNINHKNDNSKITYTSNTSNFGEKKEEIEKLNFSKSSYIIAGISIAVLTIIFIAVFQTKILYNSFGNQIDIVKLVCFLVIVACIEGLILSKVFHKDRKNVKDVRDLNKSHSYNNYSNSHTTSQNNNKSLKKTNNQSYNHENPIKDYQNPASYDSFDKENMNDNIRRPHDDNYRTEILRNNIENIAEENNNTVILADLRMNQKTYYLESLDNNGDIYINQGPFIIGKNGKGVNHRIDEPSVSRFHARIYSSDESIDITDLGSTNGTYVNGEEIKEHIPHDLSINDVVSFSKCRFTLKETNNRELLVGQL